MRSLQTLIIILSVYALLIGCRRADRAARADTTPTPWPTLEPIITPEDIDAIEPEQTGPSLQEKFRVGLVESVAAIYPLQGQIDTPVRVEVIVLDGEPDPVITISNASGDRLALANSGSASQPEVIGQFVFPANGYYELGIESASGSGQVGVSIYQLDAARVQNDGRFDSLDQQLTGRIEHPSSFHVYGIPLERGVRVDISAVAVSDGLDLLFELYDPDGFLAAARDDNVDVDPYLWGYMPSKSGEYTLVVSNFSEAVGDYQVNLVAAQSAGEAALGTRSEVEVSGEPRQSSWLTVDGRAHDGISVEVRPLDPQMDMAVAVYDPYGNLVVSANNTGIDGEEVLSLVQFGFTGVYQIELTPLGASGRAEYLVRATREADLDVGGRVATGRQTQEGDIDGAGTAISYSFNAASNQLVGVDAQAVIDTGLDLAFDLYNPQGDLVASRDDVIGLNPLIDRVELEQSGTYVLVLRNNGVNVGPYEVVISSPDAPEAAPGINNQQSDEEETEPQDPAP